MSHYLVDLKKTSIYFKFYSFDYLFMYMCHDVCIWSSEKDLSELVLSQGLNSDFMGLPEKNELGA